MLIDGVDVHCSYCMCPVKVWKHSMQAYDGDECKLYDAFSTVIWELEQSGKPFNNQDILEKCKVDFEKDYTDINDFEACINEMIGFHIETGVMPRNYCLLTKIKRK